MKLSGDGARPSPRCTHHALSWDTARPGGISDLSAAIRSAGERIAPLRTQVVSVRRMSRPSRVSSVRWSRSEEHTSELQSRFDLVCRLLLEKQKEHTQAGDI